MPTALALSPHLDDAVFSAGGAIGNLVDHGWHVVVATLFTRSVPNPKGFALACQLDKGIPADSDYMELRRMEDRAACAILGAVPVWLDHAEAPHRGYESAAALFQPPLASDLVGAELAEAIERLTREAQPDLLLAPQCVGGHVDHVVTVRALRARRTDLPVLWWRDFPYTLRQGKAAEPFARDFASLPERGMPFHAPRKIRASEAYETQLGFQFGGKPGVGQMIEAGGAHEVFRLEGADRIGTLMPESLLLEHV